MLFQCDPIRSELKEFMEDEVSNSYEEIAEKFIERNFTEVPTKHGIHIISRPFNTKTFKDIWEQYTLLQHITAPIPQNKEYEAGKIVFSLTDKYINHAEALRECLQKAKWNPTGIIEVEKIDQNKTIVRIDCPFDKKILEREWHVYCWSEHFFMKCFDMHKDNLTVLFSP